MKPTTTSARGASLFLVGAKNNPSPHAGHTERLHAPYGRRIDPAIEIERASLSTSARLNSSLLATYANLFWFPPAFGYLLETESKTFAYSAALHRNWLALLAPYAVSPAASRSDGETQVTAEVLERSMDIAMGERFVAWDSMAVSRFGIEPQLPEEVLARSMDSALGERMAA